MAFDVKKGTKLTLEFDNIKALNHFKHWLCGQGEQDYWVWMEYREQEESEGNITGLKFEYHSDKPEIVHVECGRLDAPEEENA